MKISHRRPTVLAKFVVLVGVMLSMTSSRACGEMAAFGLADYLLQTIGDSPASGTFTADEFGLYNPETIEAVGGDVSFFLRLIGNGDPFLEYTLRATNTGTSSESLQYGVNIDIQPLVPGDPNWQMRSTLQYSVEDTDGDGDAMLVPFLFLGLQQARLSDDRTRFFSDLALFLGTDTLTEPGESPQFDTGLLPLLQVPGATIDTYGVMGVQGSFEVSPGDTAVITGRFEIVPEPASLGLLGWIAGLVLLRRNRRSISYIVR